MSSNSWFLRRVTVPPSELQLTDAEAELYPVINSTLGIGVMAYGAYLPVFVFFGQPVMAAVNAFMVGWFVIAFWIGRRGLLTAALTMGALAVVVHGFVAVAAMGWAPGFHYPIIVGILLLALLSPCPSGDGCRSYPSRPGRIWRSHSMRR